jgi:hypothetical protein
MHNLNTVGSTPLKLGAMNIIEGEAAGGAISHRLNLYALSKSMKTLPGYKNDEVAKK